MGFTRVKDILDGAIAAWKTANGDDADLSGHGPSFSWATKAALLAAVGHSKRLIQPEVIGNNRGREANLVIDLVTGFNGNRMPRGGPFVPDAEVAEIVAWIDDGCPD
jgi:hypothetical protein